jgi:hypothetical protein
MKTRTRNDANARNSETEPQATNLIAIPQRRPRARSGCARALLLAAALLPAATWHSSGAAVTEAWVHRYSHLIPGATDTAFKVVRDPAGDVIVAGATCWHSLKSRHLLLLSFGARLGANCRQSATT